ncbi:MAG: hypothetical protein JNG86_22555 [Verrucomicrobiaceae bacterium]|nr:hypothetical protein [Verrucomicrobiaceae bacterium]
MPPEPTDFSRLFNLCEAAWWFLVAVLLVVRPSDKLTRTSWRWPLPAAFAVFGVSDLIEAQTGAWWHPWWLFVIKAVCVLCFLLAWIRLRKR